MLTQGTKFSWYFTDDAAREDLSIFHTIYGQFRLQRRVTHNPRHFTIETVSLHDCLEAAVAASEAL
jgi:hypothetical protein